MKKRYNVVAYANGYSFKFQIEKEDGRRGYDLDDSSMIFESVEGVITVLPRYDTWIEMKPLVPETIWKEKP